MDKTPICCDSNAVWVENVPGKGYHFCKVCRNEVLTPLALEEVLAQGVANTMQDGEWIFDDRYLGVWY